MKPVPAHVPAVGKPKALRVPPQAERMLRNGLHVIAVRKPGVPRAEIVLRTPAGLVFDAGDGARARLLPETLTTGTDDRDAVGIARELQRLGASLSASTDSDDLFVLGGGLTSHLSGLLELMAEVVTGPSFPASEVAIARDRVAQEIIIRTSQPQVVAGQAWRARVFGKHRYGRGFPNPDAVRRVGRGPIERFWSAQVQPRGSTLVVVGDIKPDGVLDEVESVLGSWKRGAKLTKVPEPGSFPKHLPALIIDRPGSVQTNLRMVGEALPRAAEDYPALALANTIFGGYFSSRLVKNIREDKGYTYSPGSAFDRRRTATTLVVSADVGTETTAPALHEITYELGRMTALEVPEDELAAARRYLGGITMLQLQTQAGLAAVITSLAAEGVGIDWYRTFLARLEALTPGDVRQAAQRYLAPRALATVMVGDAAVIAPSVEALTEVEVRKKQ